MRDEITAANGDILSVAVDLQGPEKARPFHDAANAQFTTVVDETNALAAQFGFKAVPNGLLVDEEGRLVYKHFGGFDIRKPETALLVRAFLDGELTAEPPEGRGAGVAVESMSHFRRGLERMREGDVEGAGEIWREGIAVEPDNWLLRKQLWALENPERFYGDDGIDFAWQKEQIEAGR